MKREREREKHTHTHTFTDKKKERVINTKRCLEIESERQRDKNNTD
jgi:hypothetical protein